MTPKLWILVALITTALAAARAQPDREDAASSASIDELQLLLENPRTSTLLNSDSDFVLVTCLGGFDRVPLASAPVYEWFIPSRAEGFLRISSRRAEARFDGEWVEVSSAFVTGGLLRLEPRDLESAGETYACDAPVVFESDENAEWNELADYAGDLLGDIERFRPGPRGEGLDEASVSPPLGWNRKSGVQLLRDPPRARDPAWEEAGWALAEAYPALALKFLTRFRPANECSIYRFPGQHCLGLARYCIEHQVTACAVDRANRVWASDGHRSGFWALPNNIFESIPLELMEPMVDVPSLVLSLLTERPLVEGGVSPGVAGLLVHDTPWEREVSEELVSLAQNERIDPWNRTRYAGAWVAIRLLAGDSEKDLRVELRRMKLHPLTRAEAAL